MLQSSTICPPVWNLSSTYLRKYFVLFDKLFFLQSSFYPESHVGRRLSRNIKRISREKVCKITFHIHKLLYCACSTKPDKVRESMQPSMQKVCGITFHIHKLSTQPLVLSPLSMYTFATLLGFSSVVVNDRYAGLKLQP